jgi:hypothetical protein
VTQSTFGNSGCSTDGQKRRAGTASTSQTATFILRGCKSKKRKGRRGLGRRRGREEKGEGGEGGGRKREEAVLQVECFAEFLCFYAFYRSPKLVTSAERDGKSVILHSHAKNATEEEWIATGGELYTLVSMRLRVFVESLLLHLFILLSQLRKRRQLELQCNIPHLRIIHNI